MKSLGRVLLCGVMLVWAVSAWAGERTQTFTVEKGGTLVVKVDHGDITVKPWEKSEVFVRAQSLDEAVIKKITFTQEGSTVRVELDSKGNSHSSQMSFDISVPSTFNTKLSTAGGDITLAGPIAGTQEGSSAGGDIQVGNTTGVVKMTTAGGEITVGDVSGDATTSTAGGDVRVGKVSGNAEVSTAGGEISVESVGKDLRARTAGGDVRIGDVSGKLEASTAGGELHVRSYRSECTLQTAGGDIRVLGGKGSLSASTSGGELVLSSIDGAVKAKTAAGDVRVEMVGTEIRESSVSTAAGDIILTIPQNLRATIQAKVRGAFDEDEADQAIESDFPAKTAEKPGRSGVVTRTVELNGGGPTITLETMIGKIKIRKAK